MSTIALFAAISFAFLRTPIDISFCESYNIKSSIKSLFTGDSMPPKSVTNKDDSRK